MERLVSKARRTDTHHNVTNTFYQMNERLKCFTKYKMATWVKNKGFNQKFKIADSKIDWRVSHEADWLLLQNIIFVELYEKY